MLQLWIQRLINQVIWGEHNMILHACTTPSAHTLKLTSHKHTLSLHTLSPFPRCMPLSLSGWVLLEPAFSSSLLTHAHRTLAHFPHTPPPTHTHTYTHRPLSVVSVRILLNASSVYVHMAGVSLNRRPSPWHGNLCFCWIFLYLLTLLLNSPLKWIESYINTYCIPYCKKAVTYSLSACILNSLKVCHTHWLVIKSRHGIFMAVFMCLYFCVFSSKENISCFALCICIYSISAQHVWKVIYVYKDIKISGDILTHIS